MPSDGLLVEVQVLLQAEPTKLRQIYRHTGDGIDDEVGDCFRTAIACLLGYQDPEMVPHFVKETITLGLDEHGGWEDIAAARRWTRAAEGLDLALVTRDEADRLGCAAQAGLNVGLLKPTVDHVVPRAAGGGDGIDNKVLACGPCNSRKGAKPYLQFRREMS